MAAPNHHLSSHVQDRRRDARGHAPLEPRQGRERRAALRERLEAPQDERAAVDGIIDDYEIRTASREKKISFLSGGNQQKAIIGRAMAMAPKILIFDEPTKGIDIRTKMEIYRLMKELAERGVGIILVSSEMDELRRCANRIITMYEGRVSGEFHIDQASGNALVGAIHGHEGDGHAA